MLATPQAFFWNVSPDTGECSLRDKFDDVYDVWNWTSDLVMFGVVPVLVFLLNVCVLKQIRTVGKLFVTSEALHRHVGARCTSTTATLMWISFYLIFSKLPVTIAFTMQSSVRFGEPMNVEAMARDPTWQNYLSYFTARKVIDELGISHHACNIFIYASTSKQFRSHLKALLVKTFWGKGMVPRSSPSQPLRPRHNWIHSKA